MITCERLTIGSVAVPSRAVLRNLSMRIESGRMRAIVGGAGAGKSALGAALGGVLGPGLLRATGSVRVGETEILDSEVSESAAQVAWLDQGAEARLRESGTVRTALSAAFGSRFPGEVFDDLTLFTALARLGLNDVGLLDSDPVELPVEVRRRVALAQALARPATEPAPALVVFDEPFDGLDAAAAASVIDALAGMRRAMRSAVVVLTRDLSLAQRFADEISVLEDGQIVETFTPERALLRSTAPQVGVVAERRPGSAGRRALGGSERAHEVGEAGRPHSQQRPALELREFSVLLPDGRRATPPVSLTLAAGSGLAVVGPAGSGKSVLGRALVGGLRPSSALRIGGELLLDGLPQAPRAATRTPEQRRAIQLVVHDPHRALIDAHTVRTQLRRAVRRARPGAAPSSVGARVLTLLHLVGLGPDALLKRVCGLSSEEGERLALARALAHEPAVLIWDGLESGDEGMLELCARVRSEAGVALVLITRYPDTARTSCDRVLHLDGSGGVDVYALGDAFACGGHAGIAQRVA